MEAVAMMVGFAMFLVAIVQFPSYGGVLVLGILFVVVGIVLVWQGLRNRPHEQ
jgi:uncharacterized membrane protein YccC